MPNTLDRVLGVDVDLICSTAASGATALTHWDSLDATIKVNEYEDSSAGAAFDQFSPGRRRADITIEGYVGDTENLTGLPQPGDEIKSLSCITNDASAAELLSDIADEAVYGKIVVTEVNYKQTDAPSKWTLKARSGGRPRA